MEEKKIEYKAIRKPIMVILFLSVGITWIFCVFTALFSTTSGEDVITIVFALLVVSIFFVGIAFAVGYINIKKYVFAKDRIEVFHGKKKIGFYEISKIRELRYVKISPAYFARASNFKDRMGVSWCLYVFTDDGQKKVLFWFNAVIVKELQTELYGNIVRVID